MLKVARLQQNPMQFMGLLISLNDAFRLGTITVDPSTNKIVMSSASWSALVSEHNRGGVTPILDTVETAVGEAVATMRTQMLDLSLKGPRKVVDRRRVTRYSDDRVDYVCNGISDLVAQMSNLLGMTGRSEGSVAEVAKRYAELASEMKKLRAAITEAEGKFEVAQQQVMQLMGAE